MISRAAFLWAARRSLEMAIFAFLREILKLAKILLAGPRSLR
jgi:hypothetical protein